MPFSFSCPYGTVELRKVRKTFLHSLPFGAGITKG
jgi:hypothetical protein